MAQGEIGLASTDSTPLSTTSGLTKRTLWTVVSVIAVAILLSGVFAYVQFWAPIRVEIQAEGTSVAAGGVLNFSVVVKKGLRTLDDSDGVTYYWEANPVALGSLGLRGKSTSSLTAGNDSCNGTIACIVEYKGEAAMDSLRVTVRPPFLSLLSVTPTSISLYEGKWSNVSATTFDSVGRAMENVSITWSSALPTGNITLDLNATTGRHISILCRSGEGHATIQATAIAGGFTALASVEVQAGPVPVRAISYHWYDMFSVPSSEWHYQRWDHYYTERPLSDSYPYIIISYGYPPGNVKYYTSMRLDVSCANLTELNMNSHPVFLPLLGNERGGIATLNWYMQYMTTPELNQKFPAQPMYWWDFNDGYIVSLNGTTTMDRQAAMAVLNMTSADFDDFASWWLDQESDVEAAYVAWLLNEGNKRLDIYNMFHYPLTMLRFDLRAQKVSESVVLTYDIVSWGMECLMTRWLHDAFMPTEWYFEDFRLNATIGPDMADLNITTAVEYAAYAWESVLNPGEPCWIWEAKLGDDTEPSTPHPTYDYAPYVGKKYEVRTPGSEWYGLNISYDYTPAAWNLSAGETLSFEWPSGPQQFIYNVAVNVTGNASAYMTVNYSEPNDADFPGRVVTDTSGRSITFIGPIDMWTWSRTQTVHAWLVDEWSRLGLLPHGIPWIEFAMAG